MIAPVSPLDRLARPLRNLRISVTDRCNMRCRYCMPESEYVWLPRESILTFEEIDRVAGDFFEGLLVRGKTRSLCPKKLFKLLKSRRITEEQFLGAVTVKLPAAEQLLSGNDMAELCDEADASPSLRVTCVFAPPSTRATPNASLTCNRELPPPWMAVMPPCRAWEG